MTAHLPALDGLRGVAILLVLAHHFTIVRPEGPVGTGLRAVLFSGWIGVDLFFVLSGFLITGILIEARKSPRYFSSFYARRTLRIFPLYYLIVFISFVVLPMLPFWHALLVGTGEGPRSLEYWLYVSNFAIAGRNAFQHGILDVSWSLAIEEQFYLVWAAVVWLCPPRLLGILCGALVLGVPLLRTAALDRGASAIDAYVLTPFRVDTLAWGALLAWLARAGMPEAVRKAAPAVAMLGVGGVAAVMWTDGRVFWDGPMMQRIGYSAIALTGSAMLVAATSGPGGEASGADGWWPRLLRSRLLIVFGRLSYCLYLIHLPVMRTVRAFVFDPVAAAPVFGSLWPGQVLFYGLSTAASLAVAALSWTLFESRLLRLKRYFSY